MTMIVTRLQAAAHLRIDDASPEADDLDLKILAASAIALDEIEQDSSYYLDGEGTYNWPYQLQAAVLFLVADMHRYRDTKDLKYGEATLPGPVRALLYPLKTFGIAEE